MGTNNHFNLVEHFGASESVEVPDPWHQGLTFIVRRLGYGPYQEGIAQRWRDQPLGKRMRAKTTEAVLERRAREPARVVDAWELMLECWRELPEDERPDLEDLFGGDDVLKLVADLRGLQRSGKPVVYTEQVGRDLFAEARQAALPVGAAYGPVWVYDGDIKKPGPRVSLRDGMTQFILEEARKLEEAWSERMQVAEGNSVASLAGITGPSAEPAPESGRS